MKVAVPATGDTIDSPLDSQFGRAKGFFIHDTETGESSYLDNRESMEIEESAGPHVVQQLFQEGIQAVLVPHMGPRSYFALTNAGIKIYQVAARLVREALATFQEGKLEPLTSPNVDSHHALSSE